MQQLADSRPPIRARLPFQFDPTLLARDLAKIREEEWMRHFNTACFEGGWSVVPLRTSRSGRLSIAPDPTATPEQHSNTEYMERCDYFAQVVATLDVPLYSVRLMRLAPDSYIKTHTDYRLSYEDGEVRLHVPVVTNPGVEFIIDGERAVMQPGECWFHDFGLPHSVANRGSEARVHLVIDCHVTPKLGQLLREHAF